MSRLLIRLTDNDLEAIANGRKVEVEFNNVDNVTKVVIEQSMMKDVAQPIINDPIKLTSKLSEQVSLLQKASW